MIREKLIFKLPQPQNDIPTWSEILGASYYAHFDFNDSSTITESGGFIEQINSKLGGGIYMRQALAARRPTLTADATLGRNVAFFDGVNDNIYMPSSTGTFNFLHNTNGGAVIIIFQPYSTPPAWLQRILSNQDSLTADVGSSFTLADGYSIFSQSNRAFGANGSVLVYGDNPGNDTTIISKYNYRLHNLDPNNGTYSERVESIFNGISYKVNAQTGTPTNSNATNILHMGSRPSEDLNFAGYISEVIFSSDKLLPSQITKIKQRLEEDYGTFPI